MITSKGSARASKSLAALRTLLSEARSASTRVTEGLPASARARRALARSRAVPTTVPPCATTERAVSTPRPAETPVISTRLPERSTPSRTSSAVDSDPKVFAIMVLPILFFLKLNRLAFADFLLLAEVDAPDFAAYRFRQLVDEFYFARILVGCGYPLAVLLQFRD